MDDRLTKYVARATPLSLMAIAAAALMLNSGCTTLERSRDLGNPHVSGKTIATQVCSNCHGIDGNSTSPNVPRIAGQSEAYLVSQLRAFRAHGRRDPAGFEYMWGLSRTLTDAQIDELAQYFQTQAPKSNPAGTGPRASFGKAIFDAGLPDQHVPACASCHGADGKGSEKFPRLAAQHADYVRKQLLVFQRTDERPDATIMKVVAHELRVDQIAAVADYVQGVDPR